MRVIGAVLLLAVLVSPPAFGQQCVDWASLNRMQAKQFWSTAVPQDITACTDSTDINATGTLELTPLHRAAEYASAPVVSAMLAAGQKWMREASSGTHRCTLRWKLMQGLMLSQRCLKREARFRRSIETTGP